MPLPGVSTPMTATTASANGLKRTYSVHVTVLLFGLIAVSALIGVPLFGYVYGYTWLIGRCSCSSTSSRDWALRSGTTV